VPSYYEFFAGGGMARAGLGDKWTCLLANDIDPKKAAAYTANWGSEHLLIEDINDVCTSQITSAADLAWASFPCQDLSLAGVGAGLQGQHSGTFWPFWELIQRLNDHHRGPRIVVLENVCGALSSHNGKDFAAIANAFAESGYRFGALVIDAIHFVPQSRPRLFLVGVRTEMKIFRRLTASGPDGCWHSSQLVNAYQKLLPETQAAWVWWKLPNPPTRSLTLSSVIEDEPEGVNWHTTAETLRLLSLMSPLHLHKVKQAQLQGRRIVGAIYKRTRVDKGGQRVQRAEVRFDDVAGCLRTPRGGSSRQSVLVVDGGQLRSRLISPREAARLMGLPETYLLPKKYNDAYHLAGDGVVVPVVRFLAEHLLEPILAAISKEDN
jgi:DNA (cytosine-5)-methyltransferase 1